MEINRRGFLRKLGAVGLGSTVGAAFQTASPDAGATALPKIFKTVPARPFGKSGIQVSALGFGGSHDLVSKQLLLKQALKMGVTYWDTAHSYSKSEEAMGKYFDRFPEDRIKVFLVTKAKSSDPAELDRYLATSLERLKSDYVDMFFIHQVFDVKKQLTPETRKWAEKAKSRGHIRLFGFSTHKNMEQCLQSAARLGWIDGIMSSYNYRLMHTDDMKKGVTACVEAGIGLTAMKTQAPFFSGLWAKIGREDETAAALTDHFMKKGFTAEQAKLKAVWENPNIASICSEMPNMTILTANAAASMDKTALSLKEKNLLQQHALETISCYCAGCARLCESSADRHIPISDIMRSLMYAQGYGNRDRARSTLSRLDADILSTLKTVDFTAAEKACPRKIPIADIMKEIPSLLA